MKYYDTELFERFLQSYTQRLVVALVSAGGGPTKYWKLLEWVNTDVKDDTGPNNWTRIWCELAGFRVKFDK